MSSDTDAGIVGQHSLEPAGCLGCAVGDDHLSGMERVADADAAAVVEAHPGGAARHVEHGVQQRPIGDGIAAVFHRFGLAEGAGNRPGIEVVAADDDGRLYGAAGDELVDGEAEPGALALAQPADA